MTQVHMETAQRQRALQFAQEIARAPSDAIMAVFQSASLSVETKADGSPVTIADREAEATMRQLIRSLPEFGQYQIVNVWDIRATQILIEEAGGKQLTRASVLPDTYDCLFGSPAWVDQLAERLGFQEATS